MQETDGQLRGLVAGGREMKISVRRVATTLPIAIGPFSDGPEGRASSQCNRNSTALRTVAKQDETYRIASQRRVPMLAVQQNLGRGFTPSRSEAGMVNHALQRAVPRSSFIIHRSSFRRAYTLIEILIVAVIIVLMLGMALPVFHAITGSRSEAGAANIIASMLGRARTDALGLQKTIGVAFIYNPNTQLSYMAEVELADAPALTAGQTISPLGYGSWTVGTTTYYCINPGTTSVGVLGTPVNSSPPPSLVSVGGQPVEIRPDTELVPLPTGIGVETVCNCGFSSGTIRASNGYLGLGVILFDGNGRLSAQNYGISKNSKLLTSCNISDDYPKLSSSSTPDIYSNNQWGVTSQFGLVVFQHEAFQSQSPTLQSSQSPNSIEALYVDPTPTSSSMPLPHYTSGSPTQQAGDTWLDQNATPLLLDRYTGTLIQAQ